MTKMELKEARDRLEQLQEEMQQAEMAVSKCEGELKTLVQLLESEFSVDSVPAAVELLKQMEKRLAGYEKKINKNWEALQQYEF